MESNASQSNPRIERALNLLADETFDRAVDVLNQELDENPHNSEAYWLLLVAQRQCVDEDTLIGRGIPFTNDKAYNYACRYADEAQRQHYENAAARTLFFTHTKVLKCAAEGDTFRMKKWIGHYAAHCAENDRFRTLHTLIGEAGGLAVPGDSTIGVLATLHAIYTELQGQFPTEDVTAALNDLFGLFMKHFADKAAAAASASTKAVDYNADPVRADKELRRHAATLLKGKDGQAILRWADPAAVWKACGDVPPLPATLPDGSPTDAATRYRLLAELLQKEYPEWDIKRYAVIDALYDMCGDEDGRLTFHRSILGRKNVTATELQYLALRSSEGSEAAWKYVLMQSDKLSVALPPLDAEKPVEHFLKEELDNAERRAAIHALLEDRRQWTATLEEQVLRPLQPWAERALQAPDSPHRADWEAFTEALHRAVTALTATCDMLLEKVDTAIADYDAKLLKSSQNSGKRAMITSSVTLGVALLALLASVYWLLAPQQVLNHSVYLLYGCLLGGWLILRPILVAIQKAQKESRRLRDKIKNDVARYTPACRRLTNWAPRLTNIAFLASVAALVWSLLTFNTQVGVLPISKAEDFAQLATNPLGHYALAADLDLTEQELPAIPFFFGEVDGGGHKLTGLTQRTAPWIGRNFGKVYDLTLENGTWQQALVNNNHGTLRNLTVSNVTRAFGEALPDSFRLAVLAENNTGTIANCRLTGGTVNFTADYTVSDALLLGTVAATNKGTVINCHSDMPITLGLNWMSKKAPAEHKIGSLVGNNKGGSLEGSSYTGKFTVGIADGINDGSGHVYVGGLIGREGAVSRSFFDGELAVSLTAPKDSGADGSTYCYAGGISGASGMTNSYAQGKLTVVSRAECDKTFTVYTGALTGNIPVRARIENCYHSLACSVKDTPYKKKTASYDYCIVAGRASQVGEAAHLVNSFVYGTKKASNSCGEDELVIENSYKSASLFPNGKNLKPARTMTTVNFLTETLGWSEEIWVMKEGSLPTLKPVVYTEDAANDTAATTTTTNEKEAA